MITKITCFVFQLFGIHSNCLTVENLGNLFIKFHRYLLPFLVCTSCKFCTINLFVVCLSLKAIAVFDFEFDLLCGIWVDLQRYHKLGNHYN